jgi:ribonuclease P protein component
LHPVDVLFGMSFMARPGPVRDARSYSPEPKLSTGVGRSLTQSASDWFNSRFSVQPGSPHHETHLSTFRGSPQAYTWLSRTHENARWSGSDPRTSCQGPDSSRRLIYRLRPCQRLGAAAVADALKSRHIKRRERLALYCKANQLPYARLALIVPKKLVARAVHRNRIRRLIREAFRSQQERLNGLDCVVRLTKSPGLNPLSIEEISQLLSRAVE